MAPSDVQIHAVQADGVEVFYREAGPADAPTILLLHGYPTSSFMFRNLIPLLASKYHIVAPDLPGFGFTNVPAERKYDYTFDAIGRTIVAFVDALKLTKYAIYIFDYGAPTGFRLALAHPERVTALISQNGNAYEDGLGDAWAPIKKYWADPSKENREALRGLTSFETTKWQYTHGTEDPSVVEPEAYYLDAALLARPGNAEIQLDLFRDYQTNVALYPTFHALFRERKYPTLVAWGSRDPFFIPPGAHAYKRDNPAAEVHLFETGHFALETHAQEIGHTILTFLEKHGIKK